MFFCFGKQPTSRPIASASVKPLKWNTRITSTVWIAVDLVQPGLTCSPSNLSHCQWTTTELHPCRPTEWAYNKFLPPFLTVTTNDFFSKSFLIEFFRKLFHHCFCNFKWLTYAQQQVIQIPTQGVHLIFRLFCDCFH